MPNNYRQVEFGVCSVVNNIETFYRVPIDNSVRETLIEMLEEFYATHNSILDEADQFQPSEKYASTEKLFINLDQENLGSLQELYNTDGLPVSELEFTDLAKDISYYFGVFYPKKGAKTIAIKRPAQFKGLLKKKLIQYIDDTLKSVPDNIFKLDNDFDFVIQGNNIDILHPSGFIFIADIDEEIMSRAVESTIQLSESIDFINFESMAEFVGQSKTAAKLVASIKSRTDLESTSQKKLLQTCKTMGINVKNIKGIIVPDPDSIIDFLQVLDRREYEVDLTENDAEIYIAGSRKKKG
jgi:hypothetical protein